METRALSRPPRTSRALVAAGLLASLLAVLLGAWFVTGWHDVQMRQAEIRSAPVVEASRRASELARELGSELEALLAREVRRPYFHYQNLMHDPRTWGAGESVTPSPLARAPEDRLVRGYFQIDAGGRTTTPTINDEVPALSDTEHLAASRAFRDQIVRDVARALVPSRVAQLGTNAAGQVIQVDPSSYAQNISSNQVYLQQADATAPQQRHVPKGAPVTILVSPLEWRTLPIAGVPALLAVRQVQTPDGTLTQGLVVDRATLTSWLAARAGELVATLHAPADAAGTAPLAGGWHLSIAPNPRTRVVAAAQASAVARDFVVRFTGVGLVALVAAAGVLLVVLRAERLARERSQFAAAAAHELRTPLAGLQLYGDMLADGLGDPAKLEDYARRMSEEAARLGRVVSNVLGFSQLERGNLAVDVQVGALGETLCELADLAQPALDRAGAVLDLDVSRELRARFDRDALARIIGNLLDNAEKYGRAAEDRTIRLSAREQGDVVEIVVGDRGPGIAEPARLFTAFARGVPVDGPAGLGLGLALSRSLARAMGGELSYRSAPGGGAELVLVLPRA